MCAWARSHLESESTAMRRSERQKKERNIIRMCPSRNDCWIWNYSLVIFISLKWIYLRSLICIHNGFIRFDGFDVLLVAFLPWWSRALSDYIHHAHLKFLKFFVWLPGEAPRDVNIHFVAVRSLYSRPCTTINENRAIKNYEQYVL